MYAGRIVELGETEQIVTNPQHPYTKGLLAALPQNVSRRGRLNQIPGTMPGIKQQISGCQFNNRCDQGTQICREEVPPLTRKSSGCLAACHMVK
jgi:peptide/nickel transport system ATP-binding protein